MSRWVWGYIWWGAIWIGLIFLVPELLAAARLTPWPTLSQTTWHAIRTYPIVAAALFGLLIGLAAHLLYQRPLLTSLLFGIFVAAGAHLADRAWP